MMLGNNLGFFVKSNLLQLLSTDLRVVPVNVNHMITFEFKTISYFWEKSGYQYSKNFTINAHIAFNSANVVKECTPYQKFTVNALFAFYCNALDCICHS